MHVVNDDGTCVVPRGGREGDACNQIGDPEDQGFGSVNNRSEPFRHRFESGNDSAHLVYSSREHGDPNTPVFRAIPNDTVVLRVSQSGTQTRGVAFHLSDHRWSRYRADPDEPIIGVDDHLSPGKTINISPIDDAGGLTRAPGDYIFQELKTRGRLESGIWGIFRVRDNRDDFENDPILPLSEVGTGGSRSADGRFRR